METARGKTALLVGPTEMMGRTLLKFMLREGWKIHALTHPDEKPSIEALRTRLLREEHPADAGLELLWGDCTTAGAGLDGRTIDAIARDIGAIIHCPPLYVRDAEGYTQLLESIIKGTDQIIALAHRFPNLKLLAHVSSAFVSGNYPGRFYEDWLDVGQSFYDPVNRNHFIAETKLRNAARSVPIAVFRCGYLVGEAETGQCDEHAGLTPFFRIMSRYGRALPRPLPLLAPDSDEKILSLTPNDFAARAILAMLQAEESTGQTFCLVDPTSPSLRAFVDALSDLAGRTCYRLPLDPLHRLPLFDPMVMVEWFGFLAEKLRRSSFPLRFFFQRGDYDIMNAKQALSPRGVACPPFTDYIERLYRYYKTRYA